MRGLSQPMMANGHMGGVRRCLCEADRLQETAVLVRLTQAQRVTLLREANAERRQASQWVFAANRALNGI